MPGTPGTTLWNFGGQGATPLREGEETEEDFVGGSEEEKKKVTEQETELSLVGEIEERQQVRCRAEIFFQMPKLIDLSPVSL